MLLIKKRRKHAQARTFNIFWDKEFESFSNKKEFKTNSFYMNFCFQSERDKNAAFCTMY